MRTSFTDLALRGGLLGAALLSLLVPGAGGAVAREGGDSAAMKAALAAGYKATFICSGLFNGGRDVTSVQENDLTGIYPGYREIVAGLPGALIDREAKAVSVAWSKTLPPRVAQWRPGLGCMQLPIGADPAGFSAQGGRAHRPDEAARTNPPALSPDAAAPRIGDRAALTGAVDKAFDAASYGAKTKTSGVVVARSGTIVAERYAHGLSADKTQRTWSVAKSFSASIIGAAVQAGLLSVDEPAGLAAWQSPGDPRAAITIANLLHMASGLDSGTSGSRTDRLYFGGARVVDMAVTKPLEVEPGRRFKYANNDTLLAMRALRERLGTDATGTARYHAFPRQALLWPIGAYDTVLETDWNGDFLSSSQTWTSARDMARLGQLHLQDGLWGDTRILPAGWAAFVATPAPAQPGSERTWGYGAQWWLPKGADYLPTDAYLAAGHRGQYIVVVPSAQAVIVRRGFDESGGTPFAITRFAADVLAALGPGE